jgi:hypothetical protein
MLAKRFALSSGITSKSQNGSSGRSSTSEREEDRYMVRMTLRLNDVKKRILVSLNDRSHMNYAALLGRNFLRDDFVVDVSLKSRPVGSTPRSDKKPSLVQPTKHSPEKDAS